MRGCQLIWLGCQFENAAFSGGPYLLTEVQASLGLVSFSVKLEEISDLKNFPECFREPLKTLWRATFSPRAAICPHLA